MSTRREPVEKTRGWLPWLLLASLAALLASAAVLALLARRRATEADRRRELRGRLAPPPTL